MERALRIILLILLNCFAWTLAEGQQLCDARVVTLTEDGQCNNRPYVLVFEENFDGSTIDTGSWKCSRGVVRDPYQEVSQEWFKYDNLIVSGGTLKIIARRDTLRKQCYQIWHENKMQAFCNDFYFTTGEIWTRQLFEHGKFEMRCKIPKGIGLYSAFWTWEPTADNEIDVFEIHNENSITGKVETKKLAKVHRMNIRADFDRDGNIEDCASKQTESDLSSDFHVFSVIWTPNRIEWYVDGKLQRTTSLFYTLLGQNADCNGLRRGNVYLLNSAFPRKPMHIIVGLGIQSGKNQPSDEDPFPKVLEVDYIRYYKNQ